MKKQIIYNIDGTLYILFEIEFKQKKEWIEKFLNKVAKNKGMVISAKQRRCFLWRTIKLRALIPSKNAASFSNDLS